MISSLIWLYLYHVGMIDPDHAPWKIYLPIAFIEVVVYLYSLPKVTDWLEKLFKEIKEK